MRARPVQCAISMSKAPQYIRNRRDGNKLNGKQQPGPSVRWWKVPVSVVVFLSTVAGALTLIPRISIQASGSLRPNDPMGTAFVITNNGLLPIHNVEIDCHVNRLTTKDGLVLENMRAGNLPRSHADLLSPGAQMTTPCANAVTGASNADEATMTVVARFRPDFVWRTRTQQFPMHAERTTDGQWIWQYIAN
jgi:hypothetical protein